MSTEEDDVPPEALFFVKRAQYFPKASTAEIETITKLFEETKDDKIKAPEVEKKIPVTKKGRLKRLKKGASPEIQDVIMDGNQDEFCELNKAGKDSESPNLAPRVKRRLKTIHTRQANELKKIVAANKEVLSATTINEYNEVDEITPHPSETFSDFILTISYGSKVSRLRCCKDEKFTTIFPRIASLYDLKPSELLLCLGAYNITLDDTPKSLNMSLTDTIECLRYKGSKTVSKSDGALLKIVFQSEGTKEKIHFFIHKLGKMKDIMLKYSEQRGVPVESLLFEFDGEKIEGTETPLDLDMESGNCIDVKILTKTKKKQTAESRDCFEKVSPCVIDLSDNDDDCNNSVIEICN